MAEHKGNVEVPRTKEDMVKQLTENTSLAFLDDIKPETTQARVQAQAEWWQNLNKDNQAPAFLNASDLPELQKNGWQLKEDRYYNELSRQLKDGTQEVDTYDNGTGQRLNTRFKRFDKQSGMLSQSVTVLYRDGQKPLALNILANKNGDGSFIGGDELRVGFNEQGKLASAYEWGRDKDSMSYSFRDDGSLYESLKRSRMTSEVVSDHLYNKSGELRSDYNPLYLYEKAKRPVVNIYMGIRETMRSGGMF